MRALVSVHLQDSDSVRARFGAARDISLGCGEALEVPASIRVYIGDGLDVWGTPEVVLRKLCDALARAREAEAAGTENVITDMGGAA